MLTGVLRGLALLACRRHHRLLRRRRCGRSPTGSACCRGRTACHYDAEEQRRPLFQSLIAAGDLPSGYASDDGVGLLYRGTEMVEAFAERDDVGAYFVERGPDGTAVETGLPVTRL